VATAASRKPIPNASSRSKNIFADIEAILIGNGAKSFTFVAENNKKIGLEFALVVNDRVLHFKMPVDIDATLKTLRNEAQTSTERRSATYERAYQITWATVRDMVRVNMALYRIHNTEIPQIFLGYLLNRDKTHTMYEIMKQDQFLLPTETESIVTEYREGEVVV